MTLRLDLDGQRFSRLVVLGRDPTAASKWLVACDCGTRKSVYRESLRSGGTTSCGCRQKEMVGERSRTHGMKGTTTYNIWSSMLARCENTARKDYANYGGRGIKVCDPWHQFAAFYADMGERPAEKSLDRYPNIDGNYEPTNCRWATAEEQARNRSDVRLVTIGGRTQHLTGWLAEYGLNAGTFFRRCQRGWSEERAICTAPNQAYNKWKNQP